MRISIKIVYLLTIVFITLAVSLIIIHVNPGRREDSTLPIYIIETNTASTESTSTSGEGGQKTGNLITTTRTGYSLFVEISAYLRNYSNRVFAIVEINLYPTEEECLYLLEVNINNYSNDHPLHNYTRIFYNYEPVCTGPFTITFEIPIEPSYYEEWSIGSKHTAYLKLFVPRDDQKTKLIEIPFIITSEGKYKQTLYILR